MTKEQFIGMIEVGSMKYKKFIDGSLGVKKCNCGESGCMGWQFYLKTTNRNK